MIRPFPLVFLLSVFAFLQGGVKPSSVGGIKYASQFNYSQSPADDLSAAGAHNITLAPCPAGMFLGTVFADYTPTIYVYIAGTGTAEADKATRVSGNAGDASCVISVTTRNTHTAGYTVSSASGGIKEASEAARAFINVNYTQGGQVQIDQAGSPYNIYAPLHFEASYQRIYYGGGRIECYVAAANGAPADDDCIVVGSRASQLTTKDVTLEGLVIHPHNNNNANYAFDGIHVNAQSTTIKTPHFNYGIIAGAGNGVGSFNSYISICDDESFTLDGLYVESSYGLRIDHRSQAIYALAEGDTRNTNNCFAVGSIRNANLNMQCGANGINWLSGNGLMVIDSQIQGFPAFGIRTGAPTGGFNGNTELHDNYFETGGCANPDYTAAGAIGSAAFASSGVITQGGTVTAYGSTGITGQMPTFTCSGTAGANILDYWVVAKQTGGATGDGSSAPLFMGKTNGNCSGTVTGYFPNVTPLSPGTVTYDVLRTCGSGASLGIPYVGGNPGGAVCASGSVILAQAATGATVQTFTDASATANTTAYTLAGMGFIPYLPQWPGNLVLSPAGPTNATQIPVAAFVGEQNLIGGNGVGVVSTNGTYSPTSFSLMGTGAIAALSNGEAANLGSVEVHLGGFQTATLLMRNKKDNAEPANIKGRLNFIGDNAGGFNAGSSITLIDSNPDKTIATQNYRPLMDVTDVWIGHDPTGLTNRLSMPLAFGSPVTISNYINSLPDNASWLERLSSTLKTFKVPITTNSQVTSTLATGTAPLVVASTTPVANLTLSQHAKMQACGTTSTCAATVQTTSQIVQGSAALVSGTPSTVTITGISPAFTSTATYNCTATEVTNPVNNLLSVTKVSGSSITITGPNTLTDVVSYLCAGN